MGKRRLSREIALQLLYQRDITHDAINSILAGAINDPSTHFNTEAWSYARDLFAGTVEHITAIDALLNTCSENWDIERMCLVDKNILRVAIFEMVFSPEPLPPNVCINEAIEIARKFSSDNATSFINGILDRIKNERRCKEATS